MTRSTLVCDAFIFMAYNRKFMYFRHEELLAHGGHYYDMWQQQLTKLEDNGEKEGDNDSAVITVEQNGNGQIQ